MRQCAIIVATAIAQPKAVFVHAHKGRDDGIRLDRLAVGRHENVPEPAFHSAVRGPAAKDERCAFLHDDRKKNLGPGRMGLRHPAPQIRFATDGPIDRNFKAGPWHHNIVQRLNQSDSLFLTCHGRQPADGDKPRPFCATKSGNISHCFNIDAMAVDKQVREAWR